MKFTWMNQSLTRAEYGIMMILNHYDATREDALSKLTIRNALGAHFNVNLTDRGLREVISDMIKKGFPVGALSNSKGGVFLLEGNDFDICDREDTARIKALAKRIKGRRKARQIMSGQMTMDEVENG